MPAEAKSPLSLEEGSCAPVRPTIRSYPRHARTKTAINTQQICSLLSVSPSWRQSTAKKLVAKARTLEAGDRYRTERLEGRNDGQGKFNAKGE